MAQVEDDFKDVQGEDLYTATERDALNAKDEDETGEVAEPVAEDAPAAEPVAEAAAEPVAEAVEEPAPVAEEPVTADAVAETTAEEVDEDADLPEVPPLPDLIVPYIPKWDMKKLNAGLEKIKQETLAIEEEYANGDLDAKTYIQKREAVQNRRDEIREMIIEEKTNYQMTTMQNQQANAILDSNWKAEQRAFFSVNQQYANNTLLYSDMMKQVETLGPKFTGRSGVDLLNAAKAEVDKHFSELLKARGVALSKEAEPKPSNVLQIPKGKEKVIPKTLGGVPQAAANMGGGRYTALENLRGEAYEQALSKLSPAEREEYAMTEG